MVIIIIIIIIIFMVMMVMMMMMEINIYFKDVCTKNATYLANM